MSGRRSLSSGVSIVSHILCDFSPVDDSVGVVISVLNIVANVVVLCYLVNQVPGNASELVVAVKADFSRSGNLRSNSVNNSKAVVSRRGVLSASSGVTGSNSGGNSRALSVAVRKSHEVVHGDGARVIKSILSLLLGLVSTSSPCGEDLVSVELVVTVEGSNIKFVAGNRAGSDRSIPSEVDETGSVGVNSKVHGSRSLANIDRCKGPS